MSILVDEDTRLVVQGITGRDGAFHAGQMQEYGTKVVAGVTPGKGGQQVHGIPVYNTVREAVEEEGANTSIIYVPSAYAPDAIYEAADAGCGLIVCITEGIPTREMISVMQYLSDGQSRLLGPNSPGLISPDKSKVGILPGHIFQPGSVGVVSRSGTLTYEVAYQLTRAGLGQSTVVGLGGDPIIGTRFVDVLELFEADADTRAVVLIGEIGGRDEEEAAEYVSQQVTKPVAAFIAGRTAPPGKRMGHAGAIISGGSGTAGEKIAALEKAGIPVAARPADIVDLIQERLRGGLAPDKK
jgi:succinyl-CoA synthetase alpha subunit